MSEASKPFRPIAMFNVTAMGVALTAVLATHPLPEAAAEQTSESETTSESGSATPAPSEAPSEASSPALPILAAAPTPAPDPTPIDERRPLRITGLGWELLAPGLLANDGLTPGEASDFRRLGLDVSFSVSLTADELAARLARGGGVDDGADVAVLPLPTFVATYEQLRALSPEVFFVLGWSRGRDAIAGDAGLLTGTARSNGTLELVGAPGQAATMLGLFALDEIGVDTRTVTLLAATDERAKDAELRAIERSLVAAPLGPIGHIDARELALTSADAPRLMPMVAVAPAGFVAGHTDELARFARVWLDAVDDLDTDVPAAARRIAREPGAPEAVALLEMLGYVRFADLADGARLAGLSGRDAVSLETLFHRNWQLWRDVGVLSTPAPEHAPLDNSVIARVALAEGAPIIAARPEQHRDGRRLALVHALPGGSEIDEAAIIDEIGFLAGSFARAEIELRVRGDLPASRRIVTQAIERYDLDAEHVRVADKARGREALVVRVWVP